MPRRSAPSASKRRPDIYALYQAAVQTPEAEIAFIGRVFRRLKGRAPHTLREDFAATAHVAGAWVRHHHANFALAIDLDPKPLAYARRLALPAMSPDQRRRIHLHRGNTLHPPPLPAWAPRGYDAIAALNFSYWVFHDRPTLLRYFQSARRQLARDGLLVLDFMGGSECHLECAERSRRWLKGFGPFTYVWEHAVVEPITARTVCKIHFEFPRAPGRRAMKPIRNAFTYDWRLWGIRELTDALADAGFSRTRVFWEGDGPSGLGDGVFREHARGTADRSYIGYIVAER